MPPKKVATSPKSSPDMVKPSAEIEITKSEFGHAHIRYYGTFKGNPSDSELIEAVYLYHWKSTTAPFGGRNLVRGDGEFNYIVHTD